MRSLLTPLHLPDGSAPGGGPLFHQVPIEAGTPDRIELSEAESKLSDSGNGDATMLSALSDHVVVTHQTASRRDCREVLLLKFTE
uniref:Uncharacterized protein n=1 Tax=Anopheles albimanus TaxID=7167 RepID=A0A182F9P9_ANOAL